MAFMDCNDSSANVTVDNEWIVVVSTLNVKTETLSFQE